MALEVWLDPCYQSVNYYKHLYIYIVFSYLFMIDNDVDVRVKIKITHMFKKSDSKFLEDWCPFMSFGEACLFFKKTATVRTK